jgi:hypothetical protein
MRILTPGKLDEPVTWWIGDTITYQGVVWAAIRHRCFHLGELAYLRQVLGLEPHKLTAHTPLSTERRAPEKAELNLCCFSMNAVVGLVYKSNVERRDHNKQAMMEL